MEQGEQAGVFQQVVSAELASDPSRIISIEQAIPGGVWRGRNHQIHLPSTK